jgi:hypothetical protein
VIEVFEEYEYYPLVRGPAIRVPCIHVIAGFVKRKYKLVPKLNLLGKFEYHPGGIYDRIEVYFLPRGATWVGYYKPEAPAPVVCHDESPEEVRAWLMAVRYEVDRGAASCFDLTVYIVSGREGELYSTYPELRAITERCGERELPLAL